MKIFRFTLHSIREVRQSEEQVAQKALAEALRAVEQAEARLVMMDRSLANMWQELRDNSPHAMRADQMRHARLWGSVLEERQQQLAAELAGRQRQVDATQLSLKAATQRRETLDRLLRKQRRAHDCEAQREDQKLLDELATRGAWRGALSMETI